MKKLIKIILIKFGLMEQLKYYLKIIETMFISDEKYYKDIYFKLFNKKLNINNPQTFNEKIIKRILFDKKDIYSDLADKYKVRSFVRDKVGEEYLIRLYGVYNKVEDIDFDILPNEFVLKCNHDSGSVFICKDKKTFEFSKVKKKLKFYLKRNFYYLTREWHYKNIQPCIICEEKLSDNTDYKFHCFNGQVEFIEFTQGRFYDEIRTNIYGREWNLLPILISGRRNTDDPKEKPKNLEKMLWIAEKLSKNFEYVRVDLYNPNGVIKFGEMTFTPAGGLDDMPENFDKYLGGLWDKTEKR